MRLYRSAQSYRKQQRDALRILVAGGRRELNLRITLLICRRFLGHELALHRAVLPDVLADETL